MPSENTSYAFLADYSDVAACLAAIRTQELSGAFASDVKITFLLKRLEMDVLRKLYNLTIRIRNRIDGTTGGTTLGDFEGNDFYDHDFSVGFEQERPGDFEGGDFYDRDFFVGSAAHADYDYATAFQIILENFEVFSIRLDELTEQEKQWLDDALIRFLDVYQELKDYLDSVGLDPCVPVYVNNSPGLYLQAAGADGGDGVAAGMHLRWALAGELGRNHLPKGDYDQALNTGNGYNRPDDYVRLFRTPYTDTVRFTLQFDGLRPAVNYADMRWTYFLRTVAGGQTLTNRVRLTFMDVALYHQVSGTIDPQSDPFAFLQAYNGLLELEIVQKTAFAVAVDFRTKDGADGGTLKLELRSVADTEQEQEETVAARKTLVSGPGAPADGVIYADNIRRIRMKKSDGGLIQSFSFETYHDFLNTRAASAWTPVGNGFALSLTDQTVFDGLESPGYPVDDRWPQYNDGTRVRVANYRDKWLTSRTNDPALKDTVARYLSLSETDPRAQDVVRDEGSDMTVPGLLISYLDILNLMALDYHLARMLGLGCIDTGVNSMPEEKFIYQIRYTNRKDLVSAEVLNQQYTGLPTAIADSRLPLKPPIRPVTYHLPGGDDLAGSVFDGDGYVRHDHTRLVNIGRGTFADETINGAFFSDDGLSDDFNIFEYTKPVLYGVEYRAEGQSSYVKPEITQEKSVGHVYQAYDDAYPATGIPESVPVPDNTDSLYIHFEKQTGVHYYAIYGVNWFARPSVRSAEVATNATVFALTNNLLPPADIAVQYIQREETPLLTTATEQGWLQGRSDAFTGKDINYTRLVFNWLDIIDVSYLEDPGAALPGEMVKPDTIRAWFKPDRLLQLAGLITDMVAANGDDRLLMVYTGSYTALDGSVISPLISQADLGRFTGSLLVTPEGQFAVVSAASGTQGSVFIIEKTAIVQTVEDPLNPGFYGASQTFVQPETGSRFTLTENLSDPANWEAVTEAIGLIDLADPHTPVIEERVDSEGNSFRNLVGGLSGGAVVQALFGTGSEADMPGYYAVTYEAGVVLLPHPQVNLPYDPAFPDRNDPDTLQTAHVEWYKGLIRVPLEADAAEMKLLQVVRIIQYNPLTLYVYDPAYLDEPIRVSASVSDPVGLVNYHPGYKVYLFTEPAPGHVFNGPNILPAGTDTDKKTLIGLQSADGRPGGSGFVSRVSLPAVLFARNIQEPQRPGEPINYGLKVRPDATGKAAFMFDIRIDPDGSGNARSPFGLTFYRAGHEDVLYALYQPATVSQIFSDLAGLTDDPHFNQRYAELVNLVFDPAAPGQFTVFDALPQPYGFPVPDGPLLTDPADTPELRMEKYRLAIHGTLLPLTEQTPLYAFIKTGFQTENKQPAIRTLDGKQLYPGDADFDPFPMVRRYSRAAEAGTGYVRFTDYTLRAASRFLYFYAAAEVTSQLVAGPLGPFTGPVTVLQTWASEAPAIRNFSIGTGATTESPVTVAFLIAPFSPLDHISAIRLYRTVSEPDTVSLQTMGAFVSVDVEEGLAEGYTITDTLSDMLPLPLGDTLYYRLAGVRTIINEFELPEAAVTYGSEVIAVRLIDTFNPEAPDLTYHADTNRLSWPPTANKSSYYLFSQNARGNWQRIYTVTPPDTGEMTYALPAPLPPEDADGNRVYYRFKVRVQNSAGLLNLVDKELTV
jgi:hypothetical protein